MMWLIGELKYEKKATWQIIWAAVTVFKGKKSGCISNDTSQLKQNPFWVLKTSF